MELYFSFHWNSCSFFFQSRRIRLYLDHNHPVMVMVGHLISSRQFTSFKKFSFWMRQVVFLDVLYLSQAFTLKLFHYNQVPLISRKTDFECHLTSRLKFFFFLNYYCFSGSCRINVYTYYIIVPFDRE